jgi:molecular chaperone GrpE (heat shock protein)
MGEGVPEIRPDPSAAVDPADAGQLTSVNTRLAAIQETVAALKTCFEERLSYDAAKDKAFDTLYTKLREQNVDQGAALKKNLILALLRLHDHMLTAEAALDEGSPGRERVADLRTDLLDILYAEDVEPITVASAEFDRSRQQALGSVPTTDPALNNTVERLVTEGFVAAGRVLRPQAVIVRRYRPNEEGTVKGA